MDARHCLLFRVSFGLKPDGAEAGRDAGLGGTRYRIAISVVCGVAGPWGRICHWRVCWAGGSRS